MAQEFQERTEQATPKRKEEARKKGKVAKSYELNSAIVLLFSLALFYFGGGYVYNKIGDLTKFFLINSYAIEVSKNSILKYASDLVVYLGLNFFPFLILVMLVGVGANVLQTGYVFAVESLKFDFDKLNPVSGIRRVLFSRRSLFELGKGFFKIGIVGLTAYFVLKGLVDDVVILMDSDVKGIANFIVRSNFSLILKTGIVYLAISIVDFMFQKWEYERELRMTKQEVKDEMKELEGDPIVKSRIRRRQKEILKMRMMQRVPKADVVITNPTHIAVALKYESEKMNAPKVIAKGMNLIAEKIKEIAKAHNVPIVEDKPLAQALYKMVDIDEEIPPQLYKAVAKVLAYVFSLKKKKF